MSDLKAAIDAELAKPEVQARLASFAGDLVAVSGFIVEVVVAVVEAQFPPPIKQIVSALVGPFEAMGIKSLEDFETKLLSGLIPTVSIPLATTQAALMMSSRPFPADLPSGPAETVADWPTERNGE